MELLRSTSCYAARHADEFRVEPRGSISQQAQIVLGFSLDMHDVGAGSGSRVFDACSAGLQQSAAGRLMFPFEDLKPVVSAVAGDANSGGDHQYVHCKNQGGGGDVIGGHERF
uniref:Uncharacterized protein n=1 Tax=Oryza meridionalis TaxID=40149 RepID=A0A0E0F6A8_9ORYZ